MLDCVAQVEEHISARHLPALLRLLILREIEFGGAPLHRDLLKRYRLRSDANVQRSIANWKLPRLVSFFVELIVTEAGNFYDFETPDTKYLEAFDVDYRIIRERVEKEMNQQRFGKGRINVE